MNEEIFNSAKRVSPYIMEGMIDFAKLGMNLLFISNGSAIITLLYNLDKISRINAFFGKYFWWLVALYLLGVVCVFISIVSAYTCHYLLIHTDITTEKIAFRTSIFSAFISLMCFIIASTASIYIVL